MSNSFLVSLMLNSGLFLFVHEIEGVLRFRELVSEQLWLTLLELHYLCTDQLIEGDALGRSIWLCSRQDVLLVEIISDLILLLSGDVNFSIN